MANLSLKNINKIYPNNIQAVFDFNLEIEDGEFIVFVGPSGCGKSTTLRMIAGLEEISSGDLILDGNRINDKAPADRDIAMVFQNYALYGNMTVYDNIGFSLMIRKQSSDVIYDKVLETAKTVELSDYLTRYPSQLSGGQRQRVAVGRSIARNAKIFLMDEPLSNLDAKLRSQSRREILDLHRKLHATIVYVTHDQIEAMSMATRMVVMKDGYVQQIDTPYEIYTHPVNLFVASFIGANPINFIKGTLSHDTFVSQDFSLKLDNQYNKVLKDYQNEPVVIGIRPEHLSIVKEEHAHITGEIVSLELLGYQVILKVSIGSQILTIVAVSDKEYTLHEKVSFVLDMDKIHFFDEKTSMRIKEV